METRDGRTYALPDDALGLVRSGRVDRRLFDITTLSTPAYAQRHDLRLIVMYDAARTAARTALRSTAGAKIRRTLPSINADAIAAPANDTAELWSAVTDGAADATKRSVAPGIASVWLDSVVQASLDKSVPQIGGPEAWAAGFDGTGSRIAVLDTGVDTTHPDLAGQVVAEQNFSDSPDAEDRFGHGTHVASITAGTGAKSGGKYKGVAPGARILNGKVLGDSGSGSMSQIIAGMEWAVAEKADVVNLSLGTYDSPEIDPGRRPSTGCRPRAEHSSSSRRATTASRDPERSARLAAPTPPSPSARWTSRTSWPRSPAPARASVTAASSRT